MRQFLSLLLFTVTVAAEPAGSAQLCIERGLLYQRHLHDSARAVALYREALTAPGHTPRTTAEALWHMSAAYGDQGSDRVSLLLLSKLQHDCPGVEPYAKLAAAESIGISTEDTEISTPREGPNAIDLISAQDTARLLEAAVQLKDEAAIHTLTQRLRWHCGAMVFELSLGETTEPAEERKDRERSLENCREWLNWAEHTTPPVLSNPICAEIKDREIMDHDPLLMSIFTARDAFTAAIAHTDATAAAKARDELRALVTPVTQGPEALLIVRGYTGEIAGMARAIALLEKQEAPAALLAWAETRRVFMECGAGASGFHLDDMEALPVALLPEVMGSLTFLESAITDILNDDADGIESAQASLATAIERLGLVAGKCPEPDGQKRLQKAIRRLRDAGEKLEQGDTAGADTIMRSELYISL